MPGTATSDGTKKSWTFYGVSAVAAATFGYLALRKQKKTLKPQTPPPATIRRTLPSSPEPQLHSSTAHLQRTLHTEAKAATVSTSPEAKVHEGEVLERKEAMPDISLERKVTVYVWPRSVNSKTGHAALKTYIGGKDGDGYYVSFWPANNCNQSYDEKLSWPKTQKMCSESKAHFHNFTQDDRLYGTETYQSFDLSLDVDAINKECKKISLLNKPREDESKEEKSEDINWSIFGSSIFRSKNARNCSGLCHHLMQKGGAEILGYPITDFFWTYTLSCKLY